MGYYCDGDFSKSDYRDACTDYMINNQGLYSYYEPFKSEKIEFMTITQQKCLSCDVIIEAKDLKAHDNTKNHLKNVEKKVNAMKRNIRN